MKSIGQMIREQRIWLGYTQEEIAQELNVPYQDYQKYEYGIIVPKMKRFDEIRKILFIDDNTARKYYNFDRDSQQKRKTLLTR